MVDIPRKTKRSLASIPSKKSISVATRRIMDHYENQINIIELMGGGNIAREITSLYDYKGLSKQIEALVRSPFADLRETVRSSYLDTISSVRQEIENMVRSPIDSFRSALGFYHDSLSDFRRHMEMALSTTVIEFHESMKSACLDPLATFRQQMEEMDRSPLVNIRKELETSYSAFWADIQNGLSELKEFAQVLPKGDIVFGADQTVSVRDRAFELTEIQALIDETLSRYSLPPIDKQTFETGMNRLVTEIRKNKDPFIQRIILSFIVSLIVSFLVTFLNPIIDEIRDHYVVKDKRTVTKIIQKTIPRVEISNDLLIGHRFVIADVLNVRDKGNRRSNLVGKLYFGQVVRVIEKRKDWSLIEWTDSDGESAIRGWVFSRYLKKLTS